MKIPDRLIWFFERRRQLQKTLPGFYAHWRSYADALCEFSEENKLQSGATLFNVKMGRFSYAAFDAKIKHATIGSFCSIGPETLIGGLGKHPTRFLSTHPVFYSQKRQAGSLTFAVTAFDEQPLTQIGHDVWVGARAMILDGARVGNGAIIAANAVVSGEVEAYTLVAGVPARPIRKRFTPEVIKMLEEWQWWNLPISALREIAAGFSREDWTVEDVHDLIAHVSSDGKRAF
ncbi:MAG: hypothetical protein OHK0031_06730 [Anaerolineales bacterium]